MRTHSALTHVRTHMHTRTHRHIPYDDAQQLPTQKNVDLYQNNELECDQNLEGKNHNKPMWARKEVTSHYKPGKHPK